LKQVIKSQTPATSRIKKEVSTPAVAGPSGIKKEAKASRIPRRILPETPKTGKKPAPPSSGKKPAPKSGGLKKAF